METVRQMILEKESLAEKALAAFAGQDQFQLHGEKLKRPRYGGEPPERQEWLNRRNLSVTAESADFDLLFSPNLAETVRQGYEMLAPIYAFLLEASLKTQQKNAPYTFYEGGGKVFEF